MKANRFKLRRVYALEPAQKFLLNTGAVLGSLCLLLSLLALLFGIKPLVFTSGSMGPNIPTGSLGLAVPTDVDEITEGDVVSVLNSGNQRITHRVVEKTPEGLVLKGDANPVPDLETYRTEHVDRLFMSVPGLGYVVSWLSQPWAYAVGGMLCAYLLVITFGRKNEPYDDGPSKDYRIDVSENEAASNSQGGKNGQRRKMWLGLVAVVVVGTLVVPWQKVEPTHAAFTGTAVATSAVSAAVVQPATGALNCSESGLIITTATVSWPVQQIPAGARLVLRLKTSSTTYGYTNLSAGATSSAYGPKLNLLGLVTSGGPRSMEVKLLIVYTVDGKEVNETGSNIGWTSPVEASPTRTIVYHPGVLLSRYFRCS